MPIYQDTKHVPYTARQMFDLVADIEKYPEFLPWVDAMRVRNSDLTNGTGTSAADMIVGFKVFKERFGSRVEQDRTALTIVSHYLDGPFKHLENSWVFEPLPEGGCNVHVKTEYEFKNRLLQMAATQFVDYAFLQLSDAFVERANKIYGAEDKA